MRDIPRDHVIVEQLSVFEQSDLKNFRDRLEMEVKHLRSRIGIMVGALESVGLIPAAITLFVAWDKYQSEHGLKPASIFDWTSFTVASLYIMSVIYLYSAQTLERYVLLVRLASEKTAKESTEATAKEPA